MYWITIRIKPVILVKKRKGGYAPDMHKRLACTAAVRGRLTAEHVFAITCCLCRGAVQILQLCRCICLGHSHPCCKVPCMGHSDVILLLCRFGKKHAVSVRCPAGS